MAGHVKKVEKKAKKTTAKPKPAPKPESKPAPVPESGFILTKVLKVGLTTGFFVLPVGFRVERKHYLAQDYEAIKQAAGSNIKPLE